MNEKTKYPFLLSHHNGLSAGSAAREGHAKRAMAREQEATHWEGSGGDEEVKDRESGC